MRSGFVAQFTGHSLTIEADMYNEVHEEAQESDNDGQSGQQNPIAAQFQHLKHSVRELSRETRLSCS